MYVHTFLVVVILNANEFVEKVGGVQNLFFIIVSIMDIGFIIDSW